MIASELSSPPEMINVAIGRWAVGRAPSSIKTLLGSCVGILLHDRQAGVGGLAHIVLPDSRGAFDQLGKFADTAIPALVTDLERLAGRPLKGRITAKLLGGARMFNSAATSLDIGRLNRDATESILSEMGIPIVARDLGGETGRNIVMSIATGVVTVKIPGGAGYQV